MRRKLIWYFMLATIVGLFVSFILVVPLFQNIYTREVEIRLDAVIAVMKKDVPTALASPTKYADQIAGLLLTEGQPVRITIIKTDGTVLADSYMDLSGKKFPPETANHANRPEVKAAIKNGKGYANRYSASVKKNFYYTAVKVDATTIFRAAMPIDALYSTVWLMWGCALLSMVFGIIFSFVISRIMSRKIIAPLGELTTAADNIAAGNLDTRVGAYKDEIGKLANTFNSMAENMQQVLATLSKNQSQLEAVLQGMDDGVLAVDSEKRVLLYNEKAKEILKYGFIEIAKPLSGLPDLQKLGDMLVHASNKNETYCDSITLSDPKDMKIEIYVAPLKISATEVGALAVIRDITKVSKLEQLRSQFVSNVTHELKTPLTSIKGFIELLKSSERDEETRAYFYEIIEIEAERLQNLIDDILELSEIENGRDVNISACNISKIISDTAARLQTLADKKKVLISIDTPEKIIMNANPHRLQQLFTNLIDNAIKYNVENGEINISAKATKGIITIKVSDTGIGIDEKHFERLFERFYRVDKSRSRDIGGTGLGLSIVKHIISLYGGDISVESAVGQGTTFTIRLPL